MRDDIELTQFGDVYSGVREAIIYSPRRDKVIVHTTQGVVKDDTVQDELRVYNLGTLRRFLDSPDQHASVRPLWTLDQSVSSPENSGPIVSNIRWLSTGTGFAFLVRGRNGKSRLVLAHLQSRSTKFLTPRDQDVLSFDIQDAGHCAYSVAASGQTHRIRTSQSSAAIVGTGRILNDLVFGEDPHSVRRAELWFVQGNSTFPVRDKVTGKRVVLFEDGINSIALSPNGTSAVTIRPLAEVPQEWEKLYPPPYEGASGRLRAGHQNLEAPFGWYVGDYVRIDLSIGAVNTLTGAPAAERTGWWEEGSARPAWSADGSKIVLPGTFLESAKQQVPCAAVADVRSGQIECVRSLHRNLAAGFEPGYAALSGISFSPVRSDQVILKASDGKSTVFTRSSAGIWSQGTIETMPDSDRIKLKILESFKDPPLLVATDSRTGTTRTIFDPNPSLKEVQFGKAEIYRWTDATGKPWQGILYLPVDFRKGFKYPLVIENHGFNENLFRPSGGFPSAFAASELASVGIVVLHVRDCPERGTRSEGLCNVDGYKAAVEALSQAGMIDRTRVGLIGFSRTVFYVLKALTSDKLQIAAASITDGITAGYFNYLCDVGPDHLFTRDTEGLIGAIPFGAGLPVWMKTSPDFNLDKVKAPLRIVARAGAGILEMWEPYANLERMHKPVDLIVLNTHEHVFSDPNLRLAAQEGNVDWFRFWLQEYRDPDPLKAEQYLRWEKLRGETSNESQESN